VARFGEEGIAFESSFKGARFLASRPVWDQIPSEGQEQIQQFSL
jgi:hypothetical protein